jgi:hypothetical protein
MSRARSGSAVTVVLAAGLLALAPSGAAPASPAGAGPAASPADTLEGTVSGRVVGPTLGEPVATALVVLERVGGRAARRALTGSDGRYRFDSVPPGAWRLTVTTLDHEPFEAGVRVPSGGEVVLDAVVRPSPIELSALIARGERSLLVPDAPGEGRDTLRAGPGDPRLRALGAGPGAASLARAFDGLRPRPPSEPGSVLYVRGGASDLKQVFLDGAPVYAPYHLGGLMEAMAPGVVQSGRLYTGGAPLAYDGGLSYVLDLRTRRGDEVSTGGHLDLLGAGVRAGGSAGEVAFLFSGRRTHGAASNRLLDGRMPYGYEEALARVDLPAPGGDRLAVTGFVNRESVLLEDDGDGRRAAWGNRAAVVRYGAGLGGSRALLTAAASRFDTRLPVSDGAAADRAETDRIRVALDLATEVDGVELTYGTALNRHRTELAAPNPADSAAGLRWRGRALTLAGYGAATFRPGDDVDLRAGLRATVGGEKGTPGLSPRVALAWRPADGTRVSLSTGRYHQVLEAPQSTLSSDLGEWTEFLVRPASEGTTPPGPRMLSDLSSASSSHATVRLDHAPRPELDLGLEGHFKTFHGLDDGHDLHASGADVWATYGDEGWKAWAGYSLAWTWSDRPPEGGVRQFSGRQLLSAGGRAPLPSKFRLSGRVRASSGMPFTAIPAPRDAPVSGSARAAEGGRRLVDGPALAGSPPDSYLRLDLTLSRELPGELFGSDAVFRPYLRLLNALDRRDALFFQVDPGGSARPEALDSFPVLPVVGLEVEAP